MLVGLTDWDWELSTAWLQIWTDFTWTVLWLQSDESCWPTSRKVFASMPVSELSAALFLTAFVGWDIWQSEVLEGEELVGSALRSLLKDEVSPAAPLTPEVWAPRSRLAMFLVMGLLFSTYSLHMESLLQSKWPLNSIVVAPFSAAAVAELLLQQWPVKASGFGLSKISATSFPMAPRVFLPIGDVR